MILEKPRAARPLIEDFLADPDAINPDAWFDSDAECHDPEAIRVWLGYSPPLRMIRRRPRTPNGKPSQIAYLERRLHESIRLMDGGEVNTTARLNALGHELNEFYEVYGHLPPDEFLREFEAYFATEEKF